MGEINLKNWWVLFPRKKMTSIDLIKHDWSIVIQNGITSDYFRRQAGVVVFPGRREHEQRTEIHLASGTLSKIKGGELV